MDNFSTQEVSKKRRDRLFSMQMVKEFGVEIGEFAAFNGINEASRHFKVLPSTVHSCLFKIGRYDLCTPSYVERRTKTIGKKDNTVINAITTLSATVEQPMEQQSAMLLEAIRVMCEEHSNDKENLKTIKNDLAHLEEEKEEITSSMRQLETEKNNLIKTVDSLRSAVTALRDENLKLRARGAIALPGD
jgi:hypothetical protein